MERIASGEADDEPVATVPSWTLVTSHGIVLLYVAAHPDSTMRAIASRTGLTERRVVDIIHDLEAAELLSVAHSGRRNRYALTPAAKFRHPVVSKIAFSDFLALWHVAEGNDGAGHELG
jgi:hypothetical protein